MSRKEWEGCECEIGGEAWLVLLLCYCCVTGGARVIGFSGGGGVHQCSKEGHGALWETVGELAAEITAHSLDIHTVR